ncbi:J domain-containing protein [Vibrio barjaei]|uniref:J domain-containing protein n=1 Tax=Vibrio barjaei TaxID=1676683 RepID=UPI0022845E10|nr:J domain-containing protein [Vibrio barjaei]MCY9874166.1 J domain-containing protein [Vibrio barjaei]
MRINLAKTCSKLLFAFIVLLLSFSSLASIAQLEQQAQLNNAEAQYRLGLAYETGEGVRRDLSLAAHWYQQASENGHHAATYNYAQALEYGRGIKSNPAKAVLLYTKLAAEGDSSTYGKIARLYRDFNIDIANEDQAVLWYDLARTQSTEFDAEYALALKKQFDAHQLKQIAALKRQEQSVIDTQKSLTTSNSVSANSNINWSLHLIYISMLLSACFAALIFFKRFNTASQHRHSSIQEMKTRLSQQQDLITKLKLQLKNAANLQKRASSTASSSTTSALNDAYLRFGFTQGQINNLTPKQVKARYKQLCRIYHPDAQGSDDEMRQLNLAFKAIVEHLKATQKIH